MHKLLLSLRRKPIIDIIKKKISTDSKTITTTVNTDNATNQKIFKLISAFRDRGHYNASLDPLSQKNDIIRLLLLLLLFLLLLLLGCYCYCYCYYCYCYCCCCCCC